ncbi:MAG TPA: L,D-transpeptidase family protein [Candidatus Dormibacteraeota bacterium]|nr:L,D-transpeptidase family protein [Candidatus Dormibacteraeota bacterium]
MRRNSRRLILFSLLGCMVVVLSTSGITLYQRDQVAARAAQDFQRQRELVVRDMKAALAQGYTRDDLEPIASQMPSLDRAQAPPFWLGDRAGFYRQQAAQAKRLDSDLRARQQQVLNTAQDIASRQIQSDRPAIEDLQPIGVDDADLQPLRERLDALAKAQGVARNVAEYRNVTQQAQELSRDIAKVRAAQEAENQAIRQTADDLKAQTGGNLDALRGAGNDSLADGRNHASIAAYMNKPAPFRGYDAITRVTARLDRYGPMLGSGDVNEVAIGAAAAQRYGGQIHELVIAGLPSKTIIISHSVQHLWAYENGKVVQDTVVTTGKPPTLATDLGPMKVLRKSSPWKMHSPWPKESPYWYPDTDVRMVLWFTDTGEGLHDADWQPCCWGPGSQYGPYASHGCVHVPLSPEQFLFNWAPVGTPVVVYPGDGSPVGKQLAQISTDDRGNPLTGPKGA